MRYCYDPRYNFRLLPGIYQSKDGSFWEVNDLGLRGPLPSIQKKTGSVRIIVLGASSTFEGSVINGLSWTDILAKELGARLGIPIEVINGATPGYTTYQSSRRLKEEFIAFNPDIVMVYHLWNDMKLWAISNPGQLIEQFESFAKGREDISFFNASHFLDKFFGWSQPITYFRFWLIRERFKRAVHMQEGRKYSSTDHSIKEAGPKFYKENLEFIVDTLKPYGIPLVIIKQATLVSSDNTEKEKLKINYSYVGFDHDTLVRAYQLGWRINEEIYSKAFVYCVDANDHIPHSLEYFKDAVHLTDRGREILAEYVCESLIEIFGDFKTFLSK